MYLQVTQEKSVSNPNVTTIVSMGTALSMEVSLSAIVGLVIAGRDVIKIVAS
jgi:hypothetical protein